MTLEPPARVDEPEAASTPTQAQRWSSRPGFRWLAIALVVALVAAGCYWLWQTNTVDADNDGLTNKVETSGWLTLDGTLYRTDPYQADTDSDGLTDEDEAGALVTAAGTGDVYAGYSHPLVRDTDEDGLPDGGEADLGLDPRDRDMDDDELSDGYEVEVTGTDPETADTDSDSLTDGYEDANRDSQGLDPLWADEEVSTLTYLADFSKGFVAGELFPEASLAWLAGNLAAGTTPGLGIASDVRDAVAAAIRGDWVGAGFSALGAVPGGDVAAIPRKAGAFVARHPKLARAAARIVATTGFIPEAIKLKVAREIYPGWDQLVETGASEKELLRLLKGQTNLDDLGKALKRAGQVPGAAVQPVSTGERAVAALGDLLKVELKAAVKDEAKELAEAVVADVLSQVRESVAGCGDRCPGDVRVYDLVVDGVGHEAKAGYVPWCMSVEGQIRKDAWLIENGQMTGAHWHFFASDYSNTIGADPRVLDLLDEVGIPYTIHLPAGS